MTTKNIALKPIYRYSAYRYHNLLFNKSDIYNYD